MATSPKSPKVQVCALCGKDAPMKCSRCAKGKRKEIQPTTTTLFVYTCLSWVMGVGYDHFSGF